MNEDYKQLIPLWFAEDIGEGDHTTLACIPETAMGKSQLIIKENGVIAGVEVAREIFKTFDPFTIFNGFSRASAIICLISAAPSIPFFVNDTNFSL